MPLHQDRRSLILSGLAAAAVTTFGAVVRASEPLHDVTYLDDFDELWGTLGERYAFLPVKQTDWAHVRRRYRPMAIACSSDAAFSEVVRRVLTELYDPHTHLSDPPVGAPRWPLYDLLVERRDGKVVVAAVDEDSAASFAGLKIADIIVGIDGRPVEEVVRELAPKCLRAIDPSADAYTLNVAVAGKRGQSRRFSVRSARPAPRDVELPLRPGPERRDVEWRRLEGGAGYIAIRSFSDDKIVASFNTALAALRSAPGLIIDVRENGGGDTAIARPIMGRFIDRPAPYAIMRRREGSGLSSPWTEMVQPAGPFTDRGEVVVLMNHWSGSMAEGFPMGMRDIGRATLVGTKMMGLGAAVFPIRLDRTGIQAQYSGEPVYDTHGKPRWHLSPDIQVPDGTNILDVGTRVLRERLDRTRKLEDPSAN